MEKDPMHTAPAPRPWYREPWPWIIMSGPAIVVVAGIATAVLAVRGYDGPVASDYYKQGLTINEELSRVQRARDLELTAALQLAGINDGEAVEVILTSREPLPPEAALRVRLIHPGRREADRLAVLARVDAEPDGRGARYRGTWQAPAPVAAGANPVAWKVVIETPEWRVDDGLSTAGAGQFRLTPARP
jgi:hypothetical protein